MEAACRIEAKHGLEIVFLSDAVAYHPHSMSYPKACRRMENVGESTAYFDELWSGKTAARTNPLAARLRSVLKRMPLAMPIFEAIANQSLKVSRPNRLMKFVLSSYFYQGYERHIRRSASSPSIT